MTQPTDTNQKLPVSIQGRDAHELPDSDRRDHRAAHPDVRRRIESPSRSILLSARGGKAGQTRGEKKKPQPRQRDKRARRFVGDVLSQLSPHGEASVYGAMVPPRARLLDALPLIDWQGNSARRRRSAGEYRLTESALVAHRRELPRTRKGVRRLPAELRRLEASAHGPPGRVPNLLVNGSGGIAVGPGDERPAAQGASSSTRPCH